LDCGSGIESTNDGRTICWLPSLTPLQKIAFVESFTIDNHLKTPYSGSMDFSVQRELRGGFAVEAPYVGTLGGHLLQETDLAEPVNFVDTMSGVDYFTAGTMVDPNGGNPNAQLAAITYWKIYVQI
jgi:hypothetical protein